MKILRNIFLILMLFVYSIFILINLRLSNIITNSFTEGSKGYTDNIIISIVFRTVIILDLLVILSIIFLFLFALKKNVNAEEITRKFIIIINFVLIFLIWFEQIIGSYCEYVYERTLLTLNNSGLFGSLLFSLSIFVLINYKKMNNKKRIRMSLLALFVIFLHLLLYKEYLWWFYRFN